MGLTKYILDLGRPVAYHPKLKQVTGSTTSTILLSQLIYWTDKTKNDGWIWKNSFELEDETGLTYNEQRSARKSLVSKGILEEVNVRSKNTMKFRVNEDTLNQMWEEINSTDYKIKYANKKETPFRDHEDIESVEDEIDEVDECEEVEEAEEKVKPERPVSDKSARISAMVDLLRKRLHINAVGGRWVNFLEFAYVRSIVGGEELDVFITWALANGFDPKFWTADKMITLYPQAFVTDEQKMEEDDDFIDLIPQIKKEEKAAPMPRDLRISSDW